RLLSLRRRTGSSRMRFGGLRFGGLRFGGLPSDFHRSMACKLHPVVAPQFHHQRFRWLRLTSRCGNLRADRWLRCAALVVIIGIIIRIVVRIVIRPEPVSNKIPSPAMRSPKVAGHRVVPHSIRAVMARGSEPSPSMALASCWRYE